VRAAQASTDARVKVQLLGDALADSPARDDARIPLFMAAAGIQSDELARGVIEPLLGQQLFSPATTIVQQAQVARTLGDLSIRLNRLDDALRYLRAARQLEKTPALRRQINSTMTDVTARLRRQQLNAARQPILHEALEQDRLVRPRLLARSAAPIKAEAKGGTRQ
jgi:hypothetical protein